VRQLEQLPLQRMHKPFHGVVFPPEMVGGTTERPVLRKDEAPDSSSGSSKRFRHSYLTEAFS